MATLAPPSGATVATLRVDGMDCASCVAHVTSAARGVPGVLECEVNLATGRARIAFDATRTRPADVASAITEAGYPSEPLDGAPAARRPDAQREHARRWLRNAILGGILWFPVEATHWTLTALGHAHAGVTWMTWLSVASSSLAILLVGGSFYRSAWRALRRGTSNMDTLIAMGATVAWGYSLTALLGHLAGAWDALPHVYFTESTGLLALISLGHWMEARARHAAGRAIRGLLELAPATAQKIEGLGETIEVPVERLQVGDRVLVRPGDRVAIDGVVVAGHSSVDESMMTGEPLPVRRSPGDTVLGGTLNQEGALRIRVVRTGAETALAQIVALVEEAQQSRPAVQRLADRIAAVFVPAVLLIALGTGVAWYAWGWAHDWEPARTWGMLAKSVCSVLIIACPCALGLAVPTAIMVGAGRGAQRGILIRDIDALQKAERVRVVALDKTGTLTLGRPVIRGVESLNGVSEEQVLRLAGGAEQFSGHPLGRSITDLARQRGLTLPEPSDFQTDAGFGIRARVEGADLLVGSAELLQRHGCALPASADGDASRVFVARRAAAGFEPIGVLHLDDPLKPNSAEAVAELHAMGLRTVLLSGDREAAARRVAAAVGIEDVRPGVRPEGKALAVRELQSLGPVAMVGDGINDAPALAAADLGVAIGSGADIAKETGDIVLVGSSLRELPAAIRLSRATMRKVRQNLFLAFVYNVAAIPLAALGLLSPLIAAGAMALSDVCVIGNALLLKRARLDAAAKPPDRT